MDKALVFGTKDFKFKFCQDQIALRGYFVLRVFFFSQIFMSLLCYVL